MDAGLLVLLSPDGWAQINQCKLSKQPAEPYIIWPPPGQAAHEYTHSHACVSPAYADAQALRDTHGHMRTSTCIETYLHTGMVMDMPVHTYTHAPSQPMTTPPGGLPVGSSYASLTSCLPMESCFPSLGHG
jgi:hypothetical protein